MPQSNAKSKARIIAFESRKKNNEYTPHYRTIFYTAFNMGWNSAKRHTTVQVRNSNIVLKKRDSK